MSSAFSLRRAAVVVAVAVPASWPAAAPAVTTSSFAATLDPAIAGTAQQPAPVKIDTEGRFGSDAAGQQPAPVTKYSIALPSTFAYNGDKRETCSAAVAGRGPGACPASSVIATGKAELVAQAGVTSFPGRADLYVYNAGSGLLTVLFHLTDPTTYDLALAGTVTRESGPFGPVLSIDTSPMTTGSPGTVVLKRVTLTFPRGAAAPTARKPTRKQRHAACKRKARKLRGRRRSAALRACRRRYGPRRKPARASAAPSTPSVFSVGACPGGAWVLQGRFEFKDGTRQVRDASVTCGAVSSPPGSAPPVPSCPLPPPICAGSPAWRGATG